ncbi:alpha/beta hydrolase [Micromonospora halotolerans]|uniref:Alpha/beta hydrolase n=1 Tax=Micromonospora halotolerans TaxID=709879 RepID=A0ABY9ZRU8_9ACTN|nr:alpha/beta fold hydrolase [Micromonospora halotolerans]WNM38026.1 alpha/beta hydrolase [Micromonospora halotolerans]
MISGSRPAEHALEVVALARDGRFAEIEKRFAPALRAVVSAGTLRAAWEAEIGRSGALRVVGAPLSEPTAAGLVRVSVPVTCERGDRTVIMSVDADGMLHGLRLAPGAPAAWTPPPYASPTMFDEHEVTVGSGPLAVAGTVSLPRRPGPRPGVVLLSGGGPFDRDETSGPNKPLKDLAWGLASRGVAVARFDKVTHTHAGQVAEARDFTMTDEYVPHAVAAVHLLQRQPTVDPTRVFVLGHSMGGKVAPRVAAAEPSVAGLVLLAADAQPMHRAAVRVARYLASLTGDPATQEFVRVLLRQAALVDSPHLSPSTPAADLPLGLSASYWRDLRGYDPVSTAAALDKPMLILQGGRDYQVTVDDDLARWEAGLTDRPGVTIRVYDADNHLFFRGTGRPGPADYEAAQHVDPTVVADIADWLAPARQS